MKNIEALFASLCLAGAAATKLLAIVVLGTLFLKGPFDPNPLQIASATATPAIVDRTTGDAGGTSIGSTSAMAAAHERLANPVGSALPALRQSDPAFGTSTPAAGDAPPATTVLAAGPGFVDPPERTPEELTEINERVAALTEEVKALDYERARYHRLHYVPDIEQASDEECLVCHSEILTRKPREQTPTGVAAADTLAWYQTLDTYSGDQETFHYRHIESEFAKTVMNLTCNFCHKGNDPREESSDLQPGQPVFSSAAEPRFTLRKMVNPSKTCLLCHGAMPDPDEIMAIGAPWPEARLDLEDEETPNGCQTCHEELFRTVRHQVTYLKAASIEEAAKDSSDVCYGCHGGRAWFRISYPYPRHAWPDMDPETPEWAIGRPTESDPQYQLKRDTAQ